MYVSERRLHCSVWLLAKTLAKISHKMDVFVGWDMHPKRAEMGGTQPPHPHCWTKPPTTVIIDTA
jgi:hypothetical protein